MRYTLLIDTWEDPVDFYTVEELQQWLEENYEDLKMDEFEDEEY